MKDFNAKCQEVESGYKDLTQEEKKEVIGEILWETLAHEYIVRKKEAFKRGVFASGPDVVVSEDDALRYGAKTETEAADAVFKAINTMLGADDELKYRVFEMFIDWYEEAEQRAKEEICGYNHDYADWKTVEGNKTTYDEDGVVNGSCYGVYFVKKCKYCGNTVNAYNIAQRKSIDEAIEYKASRNPKMIIYTLKNEDNN